MTDMIHDWFSAIELPLTKRQFRQLPQNPAYKYEYFDGRAWLSPRPKNYHAVLNLQELRTPRSPTRRPTTSLSSAPYKTPTGSGCPNYFPLRSNACSPLQA